MTHPPHLPPKSSSLQQRRAVQTMPWLLVFMALSAIIATSISTAFLAWYVPDFVSYYVPAVISDRQTVTHDGGIDPLLAKYIDERSVKIYRSAVSASTTTLGAADRIGQGILLSSDGWIALMTEGPLPEGSMVLDAEGKTHPIDMTVVDATSGMTYAKVSDGNFLVSSLASWQHDVYGSNIWVMNLWGVHTSMLSERVLLQSPARMRLHLPYTTLTVSEPDGSIVYDDAGAVIGFVRGEQLVPSWYVSQALSAVLAGTPIEIIRSGYQGALVEAYTDPLSGVYIESPAVQVIAVPPTVRAGDDASLQIGDLITSIDTQPVDMDTFARLWSVPKTISLRILRGGEYRTIELAS